MNAVQKAGIVSVALNQHIADATHLRHVRSAQTAGPHIKLHHLARLDERIAAHLDGLFVAEDHGWQACQGALDPVSTGSLFTATLLALEAQRDKRLPQVLALAEAVPAARSGLLSAFGWTSAQKLQGITGPLLASENAFRQLVGFATCSVHRVDPGAALVQALQSKELLVRARAYRTAGELGKRQLVSTLAAAVREEDPGCRFWAAWSAVLLGDRMAGLEALAAFCRQPGPFRARAMTLALRAMEIPDAHALLRLLAQVPSNARALVRGAGLAADPSYLPWLIKQMENPALTRLAGESFSLITGLDLAFLDLDRPPPEAVLLGPNDNPEDDNVDMDPDDGLPWPDLPKIQAWWQANASAYPAGTRTFMGAPVSAARCQEILRTGYQRQRIGAALYLCLLEPGQPLFEWRAPAWRQKRRLAQP